MKLNYLFFFGVFFLLTGIASIISAQNVGINTTVPQSRLHIFRGASGYLGAYPHQDVIIESNEHAWINFLTPNNKEMGVLFGKPSHIASGGIVYDINNNLHLRTNGNANRLSITSSGNIGLGTSTPVGKMDIRHINDVGSPTLQLFDNQPTGSPTIHFQNAGGNETWELVAFVDNSNIALSELVVQNSTGQRLNIRGDGRIGIGTPPTAKLDINGDMYLRGPLRVNGSYGNAGQVLSSNGSGSAPSWITAASNPQVAFSAYLADDVAVAQYTNHSVTSFVESFDDGNGFNPATGVFTAPSAGLYHFEAKAQWLSPASGNAHLTVKLKHSAIILDQAEANYPALINYGMSVSISINVKMTAGQTMAMVVYHNTPGTLTLSGGLNSASSKFSGFKVY